jgi:phosphatidylcholine synthase
VERLRGINLPIFLAWCAFAAIALFQAMHASEFVKIGIAATGLYLFVIGGVMQLFPTLGAKKVPK